jgi:hypothetical protein
MTQAERSGLHDLVVLEADGAPVRVRDVVAAADARSALGEARRALAAGLAARARAEREGIAADEADVAARADAFRYDRGLTTAESTEAWLAARGLSYDDLWAHATREHLREALGDADPDPSADPVDDDLLLAHLVFSGELERQADALARRLSVADGPVRVDPEGLRDLEAAHARRCASWLTSRERERQAHALRLPLTRAEVEVVDVPSLDAAREAICCVREDGADLAALARENGWPHVRTAVFLEDLAPERQRALLSAAPGDVLDPLESEDGVRVARLLAKREPDLADPAVRERVDAHLLDARFAETVAKRVRRRWDEGLGT